MQRVELRDVNQGDLPLMLAWAHIVGIWNYLITSRKGENLTWESHWDWWKSREGREDLMIMAKTDDYGPRPVGIVTLNLKSGEMGIYIGEIALWGHGVGKAALCLGIDRMGGLGFQKVWAVIHPRNKRSQRLFKSLGFIKVGKGRRGQDQYEYTLG